MARRSGRIHSRQRFAFFIAILSLGGGKLPRNSPDLTAGSRTSHCGQRLILAPSRRVSSLEGCGSLLGGLLWWKGAGSNVRFPLLYADRVIGCRTFKELPDIQMTVSFLLCKFDRHSRLNTTYSYQNIQDYTEALLIEYDPTVVSYESLLKLWRTQHTPYPNKRQYRSAIMYNDNKQKGIAEALYGHEKYVDIEPATQFFMAEEYHQNYLAKMTGRSRMFG